MPEVYAVNLGLRPKSSYDTKTGFVDSLRDWTAGRLRVDTAWFDLGAPRAERTDDGSVLRWEPFLESNRYLIEFTWRHPHAENPEVDWSTRSTLYSTSGGPRLSIRVSNSGPEPGEPGYLATTRPRLLLSLAKYFDMRCRSETCDRVARILTRSAASDFIQYFLLAPERQEPVLVVAPSPDGSFAVAPAMLAEEFITLASVYALEDPDASFGLTRELGSPRLSCFNGAIRCYMPGLRRDSNPFAHPLLIRDKAATKWSRLKLAHFLAIRTPRLFHEGSEVSELRDERAVASDARAKALVAALEELRTSSAPNKEWQAIALELDELNKQLASDKQKLEDQNRDFRRRVSSLQFKLSQVRPSSDEEDQEPMMAPDSAYEAVDQAATLLSEDLEFSLSAYESAGDSPFVRPLEVRNALAVIAAVKREQRAGPLGRNLKDRFSEAGLDYRTGLSSGMSRDMRRQFEFVGESGTHFCEEHLCLGGATYDPANCLRIYFRLGSPAERVLVGHVGRHLTVRSTT